MMRLAPRLLIALVVVTAAAGMAAGGTEINVRVGTVKAPPVVPVLIAQEQGFFAKQGVHAEIVLFPSLPAVRQALLSGAVDVAVLSVGTTLQAADQGMKLRNLVLLQGRPNATIVTRKGLYIHKGDFGALLGKRVGVDARGGRLDLLLRLMLFQARIDPDRKLTIVPTGEVPGHLAAMKSNSVDAQITLEPGTSQLILPSKLDVADIFLDMRAPDAPYPVSRIVEGSVVARDDWARNQRGTALRIAKGVSCAERTIRTHPDLIAKIYEQNFPGLGSEVYQNIAKFQSTVYWPRITKENIRVMNQAYRKLGLLKGTVRYEDIVAEGFPHSWWADCP